MFTNTKATYVGNDKILVESVCLSTDSKPTTGIANGSLCLEMDSGKIYYFDETSSTWAELGTSPSGNISSLPDLPGSSIGDVPIAI